MANNKRFFKTISLAHWHVKLSVAAQLPMVKSKIKKKNSYSL